MLRVKMGRRAAKEAGWSCRSSRSARAALLIDDLNVPKISKMVPTLSGRQRFRSEVRLGSLNVGSIWGGGGFKVMEMMQRRKLEVLCVQDIKWKGDRVRMLV